MSLYGQIARLIGLERPVTNLAAGALAPDFLLRALDGTTYTLSSLLRNGPVVAAFFKVSCPVCQFTFPFLQRLFDRYGEIPVTSTATSSVATAITFLGISQDN